MEVYSILKFALSITFCLFRLFLLTAGMPSKGSFYTLNCSVPGRCISGLLRGWLSPFLHQVSSYWRFFRCPFCSRRPCAKNFVLIFVRTKSRLILFSGAGEKPRVAGPNPSPYMVSKGMAPATPQDDVFRDPGSFVAGEMSRHQPYWNFILSEHPKKMGFFC